MLLNIKPITPSGILHSVLFDMKYLFSSATIHNSIYLFGIKKNEKTIHAFFFSEIFIQILKCAVFFYFKILFLELKKLINVFQISNNIARFYKFNFKKLKIRFKETSRRNLIFHFF